MREYIKARSETITIGLAGLTFGLLLIGMVILAIHLSAGVFPFTGLALLTAAAISAWAARASFRINHEL